MRSTTADRKLIIWMVSSLVVSLHLSFVFNHAHLEAEVSFSADYHKPCNSKTKDLDLAGVQCNTTQELPLECHISHFPLQRLLVLQPKRFQVLPRIRIDRTSYVRGDKSFVGVMYESTTNFNTSYSKHVGCLRLQRCVSSKASSICVEVGHNAAMLACWVIAANT